MKESKKWHNCTRWRLTFYCVKTSPFFVQNQVVFENTIICISFFQGAQRQRMAMGKERKEHKLVNGGRIKCSKEKDWSVCILLIESMLYTTFEFQSFTSKIYLCLSNISGKFPSTVCKALLTTITLPFETIKQTHFLLTFHRHAVQPHLPSKNNQLCITS